MIHSGVPGMLGSAPNWVRLAPNGIHLGLFKISFSTFLLVIWEQPNPVTSFVSQQACQMWDQLGHPQCHQM